MKPLAIDLYCGLGGWTEGLLAEGYDVVGFDVEQHQYGDHRYPAQLVIQDVLTLHGRQFKDAALIVGSSPCQEFSWRAMPWTAAKNAPPPELGMKLFRAQFRIQQEACEAAGRHIPMVVENVCGAQKWMGQARCRYGSYYLWGDVPALMPMVRRHAKVGGLDWSKYGQPDYKSSGAAGYFRDTAFKNQGGSWFAQSHNKVPMSRGDALKEAGLKQGGQWFTKYGPGNTNPMRRTGSKSTQRKMASAMIAKIPLPLSSYIARIYHPAANAHAG